MPYQVKVWGVKIGQINDNIYGHFIEHVDCCFAATSMASVKMLLKQLRRSNALFSDGRAETLPRLINGRMGWG